MGWALLPLLVIGAVLRFAYLANQSFWFDESVSAELAGAALWSIVSGQAMDLGNPPFYTLLLHYWIVVFGPGDASIRALSATAGAASIPVVYAVGRLVANRHVGLVAAAIFCLAPEQIYFAQEARAYSLVTLICLVSAFALLKAVEAPRTRRWWVLYTIATFLGMYTHYYAAFVTAAQAAWILIWCRPLRTTLVAFFVSVAAAGSCYALVWAPSLLDQVTTQGNLSRSPDSWYLHLIATPMVFGVATTLLWKNLVTLPRLIAGALAYSALGGLALAGMWRLRRDRTSLSFLSAWLVAPLLLPAVMSMTLFPFFNSRYALPATPAYYLLIAAGLLGLRKVLRYSVVAILTFAAAWSLWTYFSTPVKHDWRSVTSWVMRNVQDDDVLMFDADIGETAFTRYGGQGNRRVRLVRPPVGNTVDQYWGAGPIHPELHSVRDDAFGARRVWLILSYPESGSDGYYRALFEREWNRVNERLFYGVEVMVFEPKPR